MTLENECLAVLVEDQYEDQELWYPVLRLREAGAAVVIVGPEAGKTYRSKHGYPVTSDKSASEVDASSFDGVVIPGGYAPDRMRRHESMVLLVRQMFEAGKVVAAICHGGWMLCSAGILVGKEATSFSAIKDDMINAGAKWVDHEVVQDRNLITSRTPDDLPAFMRTIVTASEGRSAAAMVAERAHHAG